MPRSPMQSTLPNVSQLALVRAAMMPTWYQVEAIIQRLQRIHTDAGSEEDTSSEDKDEDEVVQLALLCSGVFSRRPPYNLVERLTPHLFQLTNVLYRTIVRDMLYSTENGGFACLPPEEALAEHSNNVTVCLQALKDIALYKNDDVDWSEHATPCSQPSIMNRVRALEYYLRHGDRLQKESICALISHSLHIPTNGVAAHTIPTMCDTSLRKLKFAKALTFTSMMNQLRVLGINDYELSRWSIDALVAITQQLSVQRP